MVYIAISRRITTKLRRRTSQVLKMESVVARKESRACGTGKTSMWQPLLNLAKKVIVVCVLMPTLVMPETLKTTSMFGTIQDDRELYRGDSELLAE
jgi:hypothetical protein